MLLGRRVGLIYSVSVLIAAASAPALGQVRPDVNNGQMVADRTCAGCHGAEGIRPGSVVQGVVVPSFRDIAQRDFTQEGLEAKIMMPHWPMPGLPLQSREIRDVAGYILSLR